MTKYDDGNRALSGSERTDLHDSWRKVKSAAIAVAGHLDKPYPDDDRWTPWSRFLKPALDGMERAMQEHKMWGDPMNDVGIEAMTALERRVEDLERIGRKIVECRYGIAPLPDGVSGGEGDNELDGAIVEMQAAL